MKFSFTWSFIDEKSFRPIFVKLHFQGLGVDFVFALSQEEWKPEEREPPQNILTPHRYEPYAPLLTPIFLTKKLFDPKNSFESNNFFEPKTFLHPKTFLNPVGGFFTSLAWILQIPLDLGEFIFWQIPLELWYSPRSRGIFSKFLCFLNFFQY